MPEITVNVSVKCPDLLTAATVLAKALGNGAAAQNTPAEPALQPPVSPAPAPTAATAAAPMTAPAPTPSSPVVPGTEPPKYSIDDIARAGAELARNGPDKIAALTGLLQQFGLQAVTQLRPDQMGPFVLALRRLGAQI